MGKVPEHCGMCRDDPKIFCPRDVDVQCLICGKKMCGAHMVDHLKRVHCVALDLGHCSIKEIYGKPVEE